MKNYFCLFAAFALFFTSCSSDDDNTVLEPIPADYQRGVLITNEGPFNNGSGTISFVSEDFATVENQVYKNVNGSDLGNIVESMGFAGDDAYIVVSNSKKIMITDRYTFRKKDSIVAGLENPRHFISSDNGKGYVTDWGDPNENSDDYVAVIDLETNAITSTISVPFGPEKLVGHGNKIYVAHQGGYGYNNLITVISGSSIVNTITVGDVPNSMAVVGDHLYVLGGGNPDYSGNETSGSITRIDLATDQVVDTFTFGNNEHPTELTVDGNKIYYNLDGTVYKTDINAVALPGTPIIEGMFYAMETRNGLLYATDAGDFTSRGSLYVYDLSTNEKIQDFKVGVIPGGIYFNF